MSKIIVLGAGMVGSAIALDLAQKHELCSADFDRQALEKIKERNAKITTRELDVNNTDQLHSALRPFDLVICAVPGFLGFDTMKQIISCGKNVVDISFFPEDALELHDLAIEHNVTAIVDCGVAPGMDNLILGYWNEKLELTDFECLVGGLPRERLWPFEYKAPFSPVDVIEEYTRPARYVENGNIVIKDALSDIEHIVIDGVGTLESFNSDGLRSIMFTMPHIPNMKEKTLRYPGHADKIKIIRDAGFLSSESISFNGVEIRPIDFTSRLLFNAWKLGEDEKELTVMQILLRGKNSAGKCMEIIYHLHDTYDIQSKTSSMARTTGYTACAAANLFIDGLFKEKGVFPPELIGKYAECYEYIVNYLADRNVIYQVRKKIIE
jgi:saccharopine dehydrogenase-like NADP-dependent oxidoreductase